MKRLKKIFECMKEVYVQKMCVDEEKSNGIYLRKVSKKSKGTENSVNDF